MVEPTLANIAMVAGAVLLRLPKIEAEIDISIER